MFTDAAVIIVYFATFSTGAFGLNELFEAIVTGNEDKVTELLEPSCILLGIRVCDVNLRDNALKLTPLEYAIGRGNENIAEILIKKGAKDRPLEKAIDAGMEKVVKLILEDADVDVNEEIFFPFGLETVSTTFLHEAICGKNAAIVKMLCDKGADVEKINFSDFTPLQCAVNFNDGVEIVRILLEAGADVNGINSNLDTALHFACRYPIKDKRLEIMNFLLYVEGVIVDAVNTDGSTPLLSAGRYGNVECMRALLSAGANVNASDNRERTILHHLASLGDEDIINLAKSYGFDFDRRDEKGDTPFLHSARHVDVNAMRALAKAGADINVYNKENKGVMRYAVQAYKRSAEMVEIALFYAANWDFMNEMERASDLRFLDPEMGRWARNKLLEAGLKFSKGENMNLLRNYWPPCHEIVRNGNFHNFRELFGKANESCLKNGIPKTIENNDDLINLSREYELKGAFALFKILKTIYAKKEPATELERRKFEIFDYAVAKITEGTYLATLPVDLTCDILLRNTFYGWKLETVSFHLALAFEELNVSLEQVKMATAYIICNY